MATCPPTGWKWSARRGSVELVVGEALHVYAEGRCTDELAAADDDPLRNEQDHFLACVRDRSRTPALDLSEALAGLKLADAAIESLSLDREVLLPEDRQEARLRSTRGTSASSPLLFEALRKIRDQIFDISSMPIDMRISASVNPISSRRFARHRPNASWRPDARSAFRSCRRD